MAAVVGVWPSDTFPVPSVCGDPEEARVPLSTRGEGVCVRVSKCVCEAASLCRLNVYSASPSLSLNNSVLFMHTHTHTHTHAHCTIPAVPRVCCQPLLLISTRRAGKKSKSPSAALFLSPLWSLIFFPCCVFDPYLSILSLSLLIFLLYLSPHLSSPFSLSVCHLTLPLSPFLALSRSLMHK